MACLYYDAAFIVMYLNLLPNSPFSSFLATHGTHCLLEETKKSKFYYLFLLILPLLHIYCIFFSSSWDTVSRQVGGDYLLLGCYARLRPR